MKKKKKIQKCNRGRYIYIYIYIYIYTYIYIGLSSLKSNVDKLDLGKIETTLVDFSKLSNVVKNDVVKKTEYNKLVKKVNNISGTDTSNVGKKTDCNTEFSEIDIKITTDHTKYTTEEFDKLTSKNFAARLAQANLASKNGIANFLKETDFDNKLISFNERTILDKSKHVLELNDPSNKLKHYQQKH